MKPVKLWVVMPTYNEEASVGKVLAEWIPEIRKVAGEAGFAFCAYNDGSRDQTAILIDGLRQQYPELKVVHKENSGHGQTCVFGYHDAVKNGSEWVFQIDSDGQCDPRYFASLWALRDNYSIIFGERRWRDDGVFRLIASRIVSAVIYITAGVWIRDANVPYRLMRTSVLKSVLNEVPADFRMANILLSVLLEKQLSIKWVPIGFRQRYGGAPSVKKLSFVLQGIYLFNQMRGYFVKSFRNIE